MDDWTPVQFDRMMRGGNKRWIDYWNSNNVEEGDSSESVGSGNETSNRKELSRKIRMKYESDVARDFREMLSVATDESVRTSDAGNILVPSQSDAKPLPSKRSDVVLPEEPAPDENYMYRNEVLPFAFTFVKNNKKSRMILFVWSILGISGAYWVHSLGRAFSTSNLSITSALPVINKMAHGYMGTRSTSTLTSDIKKASFYYNLVATGIMTLTVGIPYFFLTIMARKIANGMVSNRQAAFNSAKHLLIERITIGRAKRLERCDVYYPKASTTQNGPDRVAKIGLIFYPGALVDRTAYASIASRLSDMGILVAVVNLEPCRVVLNSDNYKCKEEVMRIIYDSLFTPGEGLWEVEEWAVGGHSMGGHTAITVLGKEMSSTIKKLVLWGVSSYPNCRPLRDIPGMNVLVINGSNDAISKSTKLNSSKHIEFKAKMPPEPPASVGDSIANFENGYTYKVIIEGGNHAGCAHYGPQTYPFPDGERTITLEQQQSQTAEMTAKFLLDGHLNNS